MRTIQIDAAAKSVTVELPRHRRVEIRMGKKASAPSDALTSLLSAAVPLGPADEPGGPGQRAGSALRVFADLLKAGELGAYLDATIGDPAPLAEGQDGRSIVIDLLGDGSVTIIWAYDLTAPVEIPRDAFGAVVEAIATITAVMDIDVHEFLHIMSRKLPDGITMDMAEIGEAVTGDPWPTPDAAFVTKGGNS